MVTRQQRLEQNKAYAIWLEADTALKKLEEEKYSAYRDQLARLRRVLNYCGEKLERCDLQLVPISHLESIEGLISTFKLSLDDVATQNNEASLEAADNRADAILHALALFPALPDTRTHEAQNQILKEYEKELHKLLNLLTEKSNGFNVRFSEIDALLQTKRNEVSERLEARATEIQRLLSEREAKLTEDLQKHREEISAQKTRLDDLIAQFTKQFGEAQETRLNAFGNDLTKWKEEFEKALSSENSAAASLLKTIETDASTLKEELSSKTSEIIAEMEKQKEEAAKLLEIVGITTLSGHYKKQADKERTMASILRTLALSLMIMMPVTALYLSRGEAFSWESLISHALIVLSILIPSLYLTHESSKHRNQETKIRRFELELAAISPYFEAIPDNEKKTEKRIALADNFFGHKPEEKLEDWEPPTMKGISTVLNAVASIVEKARK